MSTTSVFLFFFIAIYCTIHAKGTMHLVITIPCHHRGNRHGFWVVRWSHSLWTQYFWKTQRSTWSHGWTDMYVNYIFTSSKTASRLLPSLSTHTTICHSIFFCAWFVILVLCDLREERALQTAAAINFIEVIVVLIFSVCLSLPCLKFHWYYRY